MSKSTIAADEISSPETSTGNPAWFKDTLTSKFNVVEKSRDEAVGSDKFKGIKNEKYYKGSYYYFKYDEQLLKDTNSFSARTISSQSLAEAGHMAAHSAIWIFLPYQKLFPGIGSSFLALISLGCVC